MTAGSKRPPAGEGLLRREQARISRLASRREIRTLVELAARRRQEIWIVGGALRDLLLGRPVKEVDTVVSGDAIALADEMEARGLGTSVVLSDTAPRVARVAGGAREIDIAELTGDSIDADLARRDFTVNAIAWNLESGRTHDPFDGVGDLARGRLRLVTPSSLRQDPVRVLRAARLFATHTLAPDRAVAAAARRIAPRLASIAPERVRVELIKLLEADRVVPALRWLYAVRVLEPALGLPSPRPRAPGLSRSLGRLDRPTLRTLGGMARRRLRLASLAAGLGLSSSETARWMEGRRFSREESETTAALLEMVRRASQSKSAREQWRWVRDVGDRKDETLRLLILLFPSRRSLARRLASRRPRRPVRVTGYDVMSWLGLSAGPTVGALLRELEIESIRGAVRTRRQARKWLKESAIARSAREMAHSKDSRSGYNSSP